MTDEERNTEKQTILCRECRYSEMYGPFPQDWMCGVNHRHMVVFPKTHPSWCPIIKHERGVNHD